MIVRTTVWRMLEVVEAWRGLCGDDVMKLVGWLLVGSILDTQTVGLSDEYVLCEWIYIDISWKPSIDERSKAINFQLAGVIRGRCCDRTASLHQFVSISGTIGYF